MSVLDLKYPTEKHKKVLDEVVGYYREYPGVYAIVLTGSLARGKAVRESCIDLYVFLEERVFNTLPSAISSREDAYSRIGGEICFFNNQVEGGIQFGNVRVDVGFTDGTFKPCTRNSFDMTRDEFETTIGNLFVYAIVLHESGERYKQLKGRYLPFYDDNLMKVRLRGTAMEFEYKIWKTRWLAGRGEFFAALDALLEAQRIFLQHVFIKERKYPIDYVKWLREQCSRILKKPEMYRELADLIDGIELSVEALSVRSKSLEEMFAKYGFSAVH